MKKLLFLLPLLLLLTGCRSKVIYGEVASITPKGAYLELTIVGKEDTVLADEKTLVYNFFGTEDQLLSGELIRPYITAYDLKRTAGSYYAERIHVESVQLPEGYILADGSELTIRKDLSHTTYFSPEGVDILREQELIGPENVSVGGLPSLDVLNAQAQDAILEYYKKLGYLYDLNEELEFAWKCYQASENKLLFQSHHLSQDISPTAANNTLIWYSVHVTKPIGDGLHQMSSTYTIFNRETGVLVDPSSLFICSKAEVISAILNVSGMPDTELRQEMEKAFQFSYMNFGSNALDVCFPAGTLPSAPYTDYMLGVHYEDISHILHPWAIPDSVE